MRSMLILTPDTLSQGMGTTLEAVRGHTLCPHGLFSLDLEPLRFLCFVHFYLISLHLNPVFTKHFHKILCV